MAGLFPMFKMLAFFFIAVYLAHVFFQHLRHKGYGSKIDAAYNKIRRVQKIFSLKVEESLKKSEEMKSGKHNHKWYK